MKYLVTYTDPSTQGVHKTVECKDSYALGTFKKILSQCNGTIISIKPIK